MKGRQKKKLELLSLKNPFILKTDFIITQLAVPLEQPDASLNILARLDEVQEELLYYPWRWHRHQQRRRR